VLRGDLASVPLDDVLLRLADGEATGCLHVTSTSGTTGVVHLRDGLVHAASLPGTTERLGPRLVSAGLLSVHQLADAERAKATELSEWLLSELLVHLGHVEEEHVAAVVRERALDATCQIAGWGSGSWHFRRRERARQLLPEPLSVAGMLALVGDRRIEQHTLLAELGGSRAVPVLADEAEVSAAKALGHDGTALLASIDGISTLTELGEACGMTQLEILRLVHSLREAGLIVVAPGEEDVVTSPSGWAALDLHDLVHDGTTSLSGLTGDHAPEGGAPGDDPVAASLARVSQALSTLMGPVLSPASAGDDRPAAPAGSLSPGVLSPEARRRERMRAAAAAELALAHADAEAERSREVPLHDVDAAQVDPPDALDDIEAIEADEADEADEASQADEAVEAGLDVTTVIEAEPDEPDEPAEPAEADKPAEPAALDPVPEQVAQADGDGALTDTAALMRELSSLGNEVDAAVRPPSPRSAPPAGERTTRGRRKGRFGR